MILNGANNLINYKEEDDDTKQPFTTIPIYEVFNFISISCTILWCLAFLLINSLTRCSKFKLSPLFPLPDVMKRDNQKVALLYVQFD